MKKELSYAEVLLKAMRYCAYQDRCVYDLKLKNHDWKLGSDDFQKLIDELKADNFLDEERFAENYVRGKFHQKKWGRLKIRQGLYARNIPSPLIEEKLALISDEEYRKTLEGLSEKKLQQLKMHAGKKIKLQRYLNSKGYELEEVMQVLAKL